jgi:tetratricopeptide (TPR) repeat protein
MDELFKLLKNIFGEGNLSLDEENLCVNKSAYYLNIGQLEEALEYCEKALQINPNSKKAWNNKGAVLERLGKFQEAIDSYEKAIQIDKNYLLPWFQKGNLLGKLGKYKEELYCYERVLEIDPNFVEAIVGKGTALDDLGRYEEALSYHDKALSLSPLNSRGWLIRGNTLSNLGRLEESVESYKRAVEIEPKLIEAWGNMANSLRKLKKYEEALRCYDQVLNINPRDPLSNLGKGFVYYSIEQYEKAFYHANKAKLVGSPHADELMVSCIEKLSPEAHDVFKSFFNKVPMPLEPEKEHHKMNGRTLVTGEFTPDKQCEECGRKINSIEDSFFNIHKKAWVCRDCAFASLPEKGKDVFRDLENNPFGHALKWNKYEAETPSYFAYLNDEKMPPFINERHAKDFIYNYAIYGPIHNLILFWKEENLVHTSITSLTHEEDGNSFKIEWCKDISQGISQFDVHVRNFNQGISYPNIAISGLRDFSHVKPVNKFTKQCYSPQKETVVPGSVGQSVREYFQTNNMTMLTEREGYAIFARSIAECIILAVHSGIIKNAEDSVISQTIKTALVDLLRENECNSNYFITKWENEKLYRIISDVKSAIVSDTLNILRFVRIAELFILTLEKYID